MSTQPTPPRPWTKTNVIVAYGLIAAAFVVAGFLGHVILQPSSKTVQLKPNAKVCAVTSVSAASIQAQVKACANGGIVTIPAGTFTLTDHVVVNTPETVEGAGAALTHLVQSARDNVFQITAPGVTIEDLDVNTFKFWPGVKPIPKDPVPGTIFSAQSNTHLLNLTSESGSGFGFRLTGPNPCQSHLVSGDVIQNVVSSNTGTGGFTAADFDCASSGTITNLVIHGDYSALYQSSGVTVNGMVVTPGPFESKCGAPIYVTGPAANDKLENVVSNGGPIIAKNNKDGPVTGLVEINDTHSPACK